MKEEKRIKIYADENVNVAIDHCGIIYVHQQHLSIGECIRRLKSIVETMFSEDMRNRILFL